VVESSLAVVELHPPALVTQQVVHYWISWHSKFWRCLQHLLQSQMLHFQWQKKMLMPQDVTATQSRCLQASKHAPSQECLQLGYQSWRAPCRVYQQPQGQLKGCLLDQAD
jgi:hypothetical protein